MAIWRATLAEPAALILRDLHRLQPRPASHSVSPCPASGLDMPAYYTYVCRFQGAPSAGNAGEAHRRAQAISLKAGRSAASAAQQRFMSAT